MGLLTETAGALRRQGRVSVLGGAEPFADLLDGLRALQLGRPALHPDLALFPTWADLAVTVETPAGAEYRPLVKFVDHNRETLAQLVPLLRHATVTPDRATVVLATAHKAKGQEWATVTCGDDFTWPQFVEDREPAPLLSVAIARAQHVLGGSPPPYGGGRKSVATRPHRARPGAAPQGRRRPAGAVHAQPGPTVACSSYRQAGRPGSHAPAGGSRCRVGGTSSWVGHAGHHAAPPCAGARAVSTRWVAATGDEDNAAPPRRGRAPVAPATRGWPDDGDPGGCSKTPTPP